MKEHVVTVDKDALHGDIMAVYVSGIKNNYGRKVAQWSVKPIDANYSMVWLNKDMVLICKTHKSKRYCVCRSMLSHVCVTLYLCYLSSYGIFLEKN